MYRNILILTLLLGLTTACASTTKRPQPVQIENSRLRGFQEALNKNDDILRQCTADQPFDLSTVPIQFHYNLIFDKKGRISRVRLDPDQSTADYESIKTCMTVRLNELFRDGFAGPGIAMIPLYINIVPYINDWESINTHSVEPPPLQHLDICDAVEYQENPCDGDTFLQTIRNSRDGLADCYLALLDRNRQWTTITIRIRTRTSIHPDLDEPYKIAIEQAYFPPDKDFAQCCTETILSAGFELGLCNKCTFVMPFTFEPRDGSKALYKDFRIPLNSTVEASEKSH